METQWSKLIGFFLIFIGIILICVLFGGYSSLHRSEGRIESSKEFLLDACQKRLDLLPELLTMLEKNEDFQIFDKLKTTGELAKTVLDRASLPELPLDKSLTMELGTSQSALTNELANVFLKLEKSAGKYNKEELRAVKSELDTFQGELSIAKLRYNKEVNYFETRTKIFPGFIIAKIFRFNKSKYYELSENSFL